MIKAVIFDFNRTLFDPEKDKLFPGVKVLLSKLKKNYKLALISQKEDGRLVKISKLGLNNNFAFINLTTDKTAGELKKCCELLNVEPEEVLVVGDRVRGEIVLGNQLGATTVWLRKGKFANELPGSKAEEPKFIIKRINNLEEIVDRMVDNEK